MLPKALKSCPKSDKSPNLVTLASVRPSVPGTIERRKTCPKKQINKQRDDGVTITPSEFGYEDVAIGSVLREKQRERERGCGINDSVSEIL